MAISLLAAGAAASGIGSLIKTGIGLFQSHDDSDKIKRPKYTVPKEWYNNVNTTANMAQRGLTEPAINYYTKEAGRGLSSGLGAVLQAGGNANTIADLYDSYDTGINKIATADAELKNSNIMNFIKSRADLANEKDKAWTINEYQPFLDKSKANAQRVAAGQTNVVGGLQDLGSTLAAFSNKDNTAKSAFSTDGGGAALQGLLQKNRNSPWVQELLAQLQ